MCNIIQFGLCLQFKLNRFCDSLQVRQLIKKLHIKYEEGVLENGLIAILIQNTSINYVSLQSTRFIQ